MELLEQKIYYFAQKYLIHGNNVDAEIKLLREWKQEGKPEESDFFIMRYILMYFFFLKEIIFFRKIRKLCTKKVKECLTILNIFACEIQRKSLLNFLSMNFNKMVKNQIIFRIFDPID